MNALFLVAAIVVAFAFGYRFYAKLLALDIFRLAPNYSTRAQARPDGESFVPTHRQLLLGHHVAAVTGVAAFAAPAIALAWGWIPVFLWITIGSTVAAGTYALGGFWMSSRHADDLGQLIYKLMGARARALLFVLACGALLVVIAAAAGFSATLLAGYPSAVLPTAAIMLTAWIFGGSLHGRAESVLLPVSIVAFAVVILLVWLLGNAPLGLDGALTISFAQTTQVSIDGVIVWVALLLVYAFHTARLPVWRLTRPRGFLVALALALMLLLFYAAVGIEHPTLQAPAFRSPPSTTGALPWLFIVIGSGALAGWQILVIYGVTGRELRRETDATYVGYGAALVQGLVALSVVLLAATAAADANVWPGTYGVGDFTRAMHFYIDSYTHLVTTLGLAPGVVRNFAATVVAGLSIAVLEGGVRTLKNILMDLTPPQPVTVQRAAERRRLWSIVAVGALLALHDGRGLGGIATWPLLALVSLWLAASGFALMALTLRGAQRSATLVLALAGAVAVIALWCTAMQIWRWWQAAAWVEFGVGVLVLVAAATLAYDVFFAARRLASPDSAGKLDT